MTDRLINDATAEQIRQLHADGLSLTQLANRYGVSRSYIHCIIHKRGAFSGDKPKTKVCGSCGTEKLLRAFPPRSDGEYGRGKDCKLCIRDLKQKDYDQDLADWNLLTRGRR